MGITNLKTCTYEEFCERLDYEEGFIKRCKELSFEPNFVVTWDRMCAEIGDEINEWYNEEQFIGHINKYWPCQIEFEREEDVVAFKLRWI